MYGYKKKSPTGSIRYITIISLVFFSVILLFLLVASIYLFVKNIPEIDLIVFFMIIGIILLGLISIIVIFKIAFAICSIEDALAEGEEGSHKSLIFNRKATKNDFIGKKINTLLNSFKSSIDREYSAQILKKQAEIIALQSQINPHFLYNTLEAIRAKALIDKVKDIDIMAEALSKLFRYSISKHRDMVTLGDELKNLDYYLLIQQYRFKDKFKIEKNIMDEESIYNITLPKLTIQPIVENAIYHGLETKIGQGTIKIDIYRNVSSLVIKISDDGVGIDENKLEMLNRELRAQGPGPHAENAGDEMGIALLNVNQRIKLRFGERYGITLYSTKGVGTDVEIVLPVEQGKGEYVERQIAK